jgi:hypothetical protein
VILFVSIARFTKQTFIGNDEDIDQWINDYDPYISLIYTEKKDCNDEKLIGRIDTSAMIDKTWRCKWKTVLGFDIPNIISLVKLFSIKILSLLFIFYR